MPPDDRAPAYEIGERVERQAGTRPYARPPGAPLVRPLRIFTLDPSLSQRVGGVATVSVPYERLKPGPEGSLFVVDPAGAPAPIVAKPLDLDAPYLLLKDGLSPTPCDGQFHLQMVYAVCSLTYAAFRRALGRDIAWATGEKLRVKPFAVPGANAFYDRQGGLSFGYFHAKSEPAGHTVPKGLVFTALSHDVVVHETTHALLDGLRSQFQEPTHPDVLGFHEGFADLVALFQHFTYATVVEEAIRQLRHLGHVGLLSDLAREFGYARSSPKHAAAMRSAVDVGGILAFDSDAPAASQGGPRLYEPGLEEHALGSVLVSAVFEAFVTIFRRKSERYLRIAGLAPEDLGRRELGSELLRALADEASALARQFLDVCIRAIDYCPPVDMELGEYLRALVTADAEVVPDDKWGYREALMRSFRRRHIFPDHVGFMTEDAVKWRPPEATIEIEGLAFSRLRFDGEPGHAAGAIELRRQADALGAFVSTPRGAAALGLFAVGGLRPKGIEYLAPPRIESIRCARRSSPDGAIVFDLIAEVLQSGTVRREGVLFDFSGGCTLVIDPFGKVRYAIYKKLGSEERQERQERAIRGRLKRYWQKKDGRHRSISGVFRALHGAAPAAGPHPARKSGRGGRKGR